MKFNGFATLIIVCIKLSKFCLSLCGTMMAQESKLLTESICLERKALVQSALSFACSGFSFPLGVAKIIFSRSRTRPRTEASSLLNLNPQLSNFCFTWNQEKTLKIILYSLLFISSHITLVNHDATKALQNFHTNRNMYYRTTSKRMNIFFKLN